MSKMTLNVAKGRKMTQNDSKIHINTQVLVQEISAKLIGRIVVVRNYEEILIKTKKERDF